jgi:hypothetical protein
LGAAGWTLVIPALIARVLQNNCCYLLT